MEQQQKRGARYYFYSGKGRVGWKVRKFPERRRDGKQSEGGGSAKSAPRLFPHKTSLVGKKGEKYSQRFSLSKIATEEKEREKVFSSSSLHLHTTYTFFSPHPDYTALLLPSSPPARLHNAYQIRGALPPPLISPSRVGIGFPKSSPPPAPHHENNCSRKGFSAKVFKVVAFFGCAIMYVRRERVRVGKFPPFSPNAVVKLKK